jgi:hypothetical protein
MDQTISYHSTAAFLDIVSLRLKKKDKIYCSFILDDNKRSDGTVSRVASTQITFFQSGNKHQLLLVEDCGTIKETMTEDDNKKLQSAHVVYSLQFRAFTNYFSKSEYNVIPARVGEVVNAVQDSKIIQTITQKFLADLEIQRKKMEEDKNKPVDITTPTIVKEELPTVQA